MALPAGSIRGLLALQIAIIFWILLIVPSDPERRIPIPLNLYFLHAMVMMFFVSHGKSIAKRGEPSRRRCGFPAARFRFILLAGTIAVVRRTSRFDIQNASHG